MLTKHSQQLLVFYETPKRILGALEFIEEHYRITAFSVAKELTKLYEQFWYSLDDVLQYLRGLESIKGEWVCGLIVEPRCSPKTLDWVVKLRDKGVSFKDLVAISKELGTASRSELFEAYHD